MSRYRFEGEEIHDLEINVLKSLGWKLNYPNLGDLGRMLLLSLVEKPAEAVFGHVEEMMDFCISSKKL